MLKALGILSVVLFPWHLVAQSSFWEVKASGEYMLTAYSFSSPHNTWASSLDIAWWQTIDDYRLGLSADFGFNPNSICGHRFGGEFMVSSPFCKWLDWKMGLGLSAYTRPLPYTADSNNVYISTWLTFMVDLGLQFKLDKEWSLELGLLHSSNGNLKRPNRGLNYFRAGLGYTFPTHSSSIGPFAKVNTDTSYRIHQAGAMLSFGLTRSRHSMQTGIFPCYDLSLNYRWRPSMKWAMGGTVDFWYNFSHVWQVPHYHDPYTFPVYVGALYYLESHLGPLSIRGGIGYTLLASSRVMVLAYERLSVYYNIGQHYIGLGINAHGGQAEFVEWSYGFWLPLGNH